VRGANVISVHFGRLPARFCTNGKADSEGAGY
jgi:hypothetical protein